MCPSVCIVLFMWCSMFTCCMLCTNGCKNAASPIGPIGPIGWRCRCLPRAAVVLRRGDPINVIQYLSFEHSSHCNHAGSHLFLIPGFTHSILPNLNQRFQTTTSFGVTRRKYPQRPPLLQLDPFFLSTCHFQKLPLAPRWLICK